MLSASFPPTFEAGHSRLYAPEENRMWWVFEPRWWVASDSETIAAIRMRMLVSFATGGRGIEMRSRLGLPFGMWILDHGNIASF